MSPVTTESEMDLLISKTSSQTLISQSSQKDHQNNSQTLNSTEPKKSETCNGLSDKPVDLPIYLSIKPTNVKPKTNVVSRKAQMTSATNNVAVNTIPTAWPNSLTLNLSPINQKGEFPGVQISHPSFGQPIILQVLPLSGSKTDEQFEVHVPTQLILNAVNSYKGVQNSNTPIVLPISSKGLFPKTTLQKIAAKDAIKKPSNSPSRCNSPASNNGSKSKTSNNRKVSISNIAVSIPNTFPTVVQAPSIVTSNAYAAQPHPITVQPPPLTAAFASGTGALPPPTPSFLPPTGQPILLTSSTNGQVTILNSAPTSTSTPFIPNFFQAPRAQQPPILTASMDPNTGLITYFTTSQPAPNIIGAQTSMFVQGPRFISPLQTPVSLPTTLPQNYFNVPVTVAETVITDSTTTSSAEADCGDILSLAWKLTQMDDNPEVVCLNSAPDEVRKPPTPINDEDIDALLQQAALVAKEGVDKDKRPITSTPERHNNLAELDDSQIRSVLCSTNAEEAQERARNVSDSDSFFNSLVGDQDTLVELTEALDKTNKNHQSFTDVLGENFSKNTDNCPSINQIQPSIITTVRSNSFLDSFSRNIASMEELDEALLLLGPPGEEELSRVVEEINRTSKTTKKRNQEEHTAASGLLKDINQSEENQLITHSPYKNNKGESDGNSHRASPSDETCPEHLGDDELDQLAADRAFFDEEPDVGPDDQELFNLLFFPNPEDHLQKDPAKLKSDKVESNDVDVSSGSELDFLPAKIQKSPVKLLEETEGISTESAKDSDAETTMAMSLEQPRRRRSRSSRPSSIGSKSPTKRSSSTLVSPKSRTSSRKSFIQESDDKSSDSIVSRLRRRSNTKSSSIASPVSIKSKSMPNEDEEDSLQISAEDESEENEDEDINGISSHQLQELSYHQADSSSLVAGQSFLEVITSQSLLIDAAVKGLEDFAEDNDEDISPIKSKFKGLDSLDRMLKTCQRRSGRHSVKSSNESASSNSINSEQSSMQRTAAEGLNNSELLSHPLLINPTASSSPTHDFSPLIEPVSAQPKTRGRRKKPQPKLPPVPVQGPISPRRMRNSTQNVTKASAGVIRRTRCRRSSPGNSSVRSQDSERTMDSSLPQTPGQIVGFEDFASSPKQSVTSFAPKDLQIDLLNKNPMIFPTKTNRPRSFGILDQNTLNGNIASKVVLSPPKKITEVASFACLSKDHPDAAHDKIYFESPSQRSDYDDENNEPQNSPERNFFETVCDVRIPLKGIEAIQIIKSSSDTQDSSFSKFASSDLPSFQNPNSNNISTSLSTRMSFETIAAASTPQNLKPNQKMIIELSKCESSFDSILGTGNFAASAAFRSTDFAALAAQASQKSQISGNNSFAELAKCSEKVIGKVDEMCPKFFLPDNLRLLDPHSPAFSSSSKISTVTSSSLSNSYPVSEVPIDEEDRTLLIEKPKSPKKIKLRGKRKRSSDYANRHKKRHLIVSPQAGCQRVFDEDVVEDEEDTQLEPETQPEDDVLEPLAEVDVSSTYSTLSVPSIQPSSQMEPLNLSVNDNKSDKPSLKIKLRLPMSSGDLTPLTVSSDNNENSKAERRRLREERRQLKIAKKKERKERQKQPLVLTESVNCPLPQSEEPQKAEQSEPSTTTTNQQSSWSSEESTVNQPPVKQTPSWISRPAGASRGRGSRGGRGGGSRGRGSANLKFTPVGVIRKESQQVIPPQPVDQFNSGEPISKKFFSTNKQDRRSSTIPSTWRSPNNSPIKKQTNVGSKLLCESSGSVMMNAQKPTQVLEAVQENKEIQTSAAESQVKKPLKLIIRLGSNSVPIIPQGNTIDESYTVDVNAPSSNQSLSSDNQNLQDDFQDEEVVDEDEAALDMFFSVARNPEPFVDHCQTQIKRIVNEFLVDEPSSLMQFMEGSNRPDLRTHFSRDQESSFSQQTSISSQQSPPKKRQMPSTDVSVRALSSPQTSIYDASVSGYTSVQSSVSVDDDKGSQDLYGSYYRRHPSGVSQQNKQQIGSPLNSTISVTSPYGTQQMSSTCPRSSTHTVNSPLDLASNQQLKSPMQHYQNAPSNTVQDISQSTDVTKTRVPENSADFSHHLNDLSSYFSQYYYAAQQAAASGTRTNDKDSSRDNNSSTSTDSSSNVPAVSTSTRQQTSSGSNTATNPWDLFNAPGPSTISGTSGFQTSASVARSLSQQQQPQQPQSQQQQQQQQQRLYTDEEQQVFIAAAQYAAQLESVAGRSSSAQQTNSSRQSQDPSQSYYDQFAQAWSQHFASSGPNLTESADTSTSSSNQLLNTTNRYNQDYSSSNSHQRVSQTSQQSNSSSRTQNTSSVTNYGSTNPSNMMMSMMEESYNNLAAAAMFNSYLAARGSVDLNNPFGNYANSGSTPAQNTQGSGSVRANFSDNQHHSAGRSSNSQGQRSTADEYLDWMNRFSSSSGYENPLDFMSRMAASASNGSTQYGSAVRSSNSGYDSMTSVPQRRSSDVSQQNAMTTYQERMAAMAYSAYEMMMMGTNPSANSSSSAGASKSKH